MHETSDQIKDRMLKLAARMWTGEEYLPEASFDPLVGMLLSACASELSAISGEVEESRLRVTERLIDMMVPEVNAGVLPAHALSTALPVEEELLLQAGDSFYANAAVGNTEPRSLYFSPAGNFKLVKGQLAGMLHSGGYHTFGLLHSKTQVLNLHRSDALAPGELWLALKLPSGLRDLKDLSLYFDSRSKTFSRNFYYLLRNSTWSANGRPVEMNPGFSTLLNDDDFLFKIFGKKEIRHHSRMTHIRSFYSEKFITLQLQREHLVAGMPEKFHSLKDRIPEETAAEMDSMVWLKVVFPQNIEPWQFDELFCSINTFPVANLQNVTKIFKTRKFLNLFALSDPDYFFDMESVGDSDGLQYLESGVERTGDLHENHYVLRSNGVESFDTRSASEHITRLLEKLKNESASFSFLDKLNFNSDLKTLNQIMGRIETSLEQLPRFASTVYLYLNSRTDNKPVFVNYRTTAGDLANGLKPATPLSLYAGSHIKQGSAFLMTAAQGGRSKMSREDRMNAYRKALLTRDRIVSEEDLKAFCHAQFGRYLKQVEVKKSIQKDMAPGGGFTRTIDLHLHLSEEGSISSEELQFLCKDLLVTLEKKSTGIFPYRVFVKNELIEA